MRDDWVFFLRFKELGGTDVACKLYGNSAMREELRLERDLIAALILPTDVYIAFQRSLLGECVDFELDDKGWATACRRLQ